MKSNFTISDNGYNISCKLYVHENEPIQKIILFGHGFAGHKNNGKAQQFANLILKRFSGTAVLTYNLPAHGDDENKCIILHDCLDYMEIVLNYVKNSMHIVDIYSYATSFGGYLVLAYILAHGNPFRKIALRCPAVNMAEVLTDKIIKAEELTRIRNGESIQVGFDRKIEIKQQFILDLEKSDIQNSDFSEYSGDILIIHGTDDEIVPFEAGRKFAEHNSIPFIPVEGADHRFQDSKCTALANEEILAFFNCSKKIVVVNAGPRKGWNTDTLLTEAAKGAIEAGAEIVSFDLFRLEKYTGCISCFGCKKEKFKGHCICKDGLTPVLDAIREADGLIIGSPNYLGEMTASFRALYERLVFQSLTYNMETPCCKERAIPVLLILTSNAPDTFYQTLLHNYQQTLTTFVGPTEIFACGDTLQLKDYSKTDWEWSMFRPEAKMERHETVFPEECKKAYQVGRNLVQGE